MKLAGLLVRSGLAVAGTGIYLLFKRFLNNAKKTEKEVEKKVKAKKKAVVKAVAAKKPTAKPRQKRTPVPAININA